MQTQETNTASRERNEPVAVTAPSACAVDQEKRASGKEQVAVLVCHGMGQQVPFETIDGVAASIKAAADRHPAGAKASSATVKVVELEQGKERKRLPRAEIEMTTGSKEVQVHVYEAYWAPLTEGKATLRDVHSFLWDAAVNSAINCIKYKRFSRYVFGGFKEFEVPRWK